MNRREAEDIVFEYGRAVSNISSVFKPQSSLPCSKARIRNAYFVFIQALIEEMGTLSKKTGEQLVLTYCMMDAFVPDDRAEQLNSIAGKIKCGELIAARPEEKCQIDEYMSLVVSALRNARDHDEINEFIAECYKERACRPGRG